MQAFSFNTSKSIINQPGGLRQLGDICQQQGIGHALIVTDPGIVASGLLEHLQNALLASGITFTLFKEVVADPPESVVLAGIGLAEQAAVDGVIGFGGGSSMDTAKLIALLANSDESLADVYGVNQAAGSRLPLVLIPTTAGTGSEVTAVAIVTTGETTKSGVVANQLLPDVALLDAELTLGLPAHVTAATGVDAMVHAIEAYTSVHRKNPYSDMLAREALLLMSRNLHTATHDGSQLAAREAMLYGACLAGQAFANAPVAAVHALAYPLGGHYHIPHGLSNSLVLPHVLRFNAPQAANLYAELARSILPVEQLKGGAKEITERFIAWLQNLISELELPHSLRELDIAEEDLPMLARDAMLQQRLLINNPREVLEQDALAIYQAAW